MSHVNLSRRVRVWSLVCLGAVAAWLFFQIFADRSNVEPEQRKPDVPVRLLSDGDHYIGALSAPIQLIVYSDLECKYCKTLHVRTLHELRRKFGSDLVVAFRHMPLPSRQKALPEAEAAECAALVGGERAFHSFIDEVYRITPSDNGLDLTQLPSIAERVGVNREKFELCRREGQSVERVRIDRQEAAIAGMSITPSIVIVYGGHSTLVAGDFPSRIMTAIEYLRARSE